MLDKKSYVPMSKQIVDIICIRIIQGIYKLKDKLPSQNMFAQEFEVSTITIRNAFKELSRKGFIDSFKGKGSFVIGIPSTHQGVHSAQGLTMDQKSLLSSLDTKIINIDLSFPHTEASYKLQLKERHPILINRLRIINNTNISLEYSFLSPLLFLDINWKIELSDNLSLYEFIRDKYDYQIAQAIENIYPVIPSKEIQTILSLKDNTPILLIKRTTYFKDHHIPFEYCENYILPEYYGQVIYSS